MTSFNVASVFIFYGIFATLGGIVAVAAHRRLDLSARYWALGALLSGVTVLTTAARESLPPLFGYSIPIGVHIVSYVLLGQGLAILGQTTSNSDKFMDRLLYGTVVFICVLELVRRFVGPEAALVVASLGFGSTAIWSSAMAQAQYLRTKCIFTLWMRWTLYATGVVQLIRIQGAFSGLASHAFAQDAVNLAVYTLLFVLALLRFMFYLAIRLQEKVAEAKQATLRAEKANGDLRARTAFISSAMQEAPVACVIADAQDNVLIGNREAERLLGRTFPAQGQPARVPLKVEHLFVGMGASYEWAPRQTQKLFSRSGYAGDARCVSVRGEAFPDNQETPQQVFVLSEESVSIAQARAMITTQALESGCSLLLARREGDVLAASPGWSELQVETGLTSHAEAGVSFWETLESLQGNAPSSLSPVARREAPAKALQMARKRATEDGRSSSAFLRLRDGRHCDVMFDLIALSDLGEKALLVEVRARPGPSPLIVPKGEPLADLPPALPRSLSMPSEGT